MANQEELLLNVFRKHTDMELAKACQAEDCPVSPEHCPFMGRRGAAGCFGIKDDDWRIARGAYLPECSTHSHTAPARGSVLLEAHDTINGQRVDQYGEPEDCFGDIADAWQKWLGDVSRPITRRDVAVMMAILKLVREMHAPKRDNLLDACGYLALAADMTEATDDA